MLRQIIQIDQDLCIGCGLCMRSCTHGAIKLENNLAVVDQSICKLCDDPTCLAKCPTRAIEAMTGIKETCQTA